MGTVRNTAAITKDIIEGLKTTIRNLYLADNIPWIIGYSGGKDSTATLQLVWLALAEMPKEKLTKTVHIINTDTLVESPVVAKWAQNSLKKMDDAAAEQGLPFETHILTPKKNNTYWVNLLGKGYAFPRKKYRWCTDRLKIKPVNDFIKECIAKHGEIILVLGTRKVESANRARTMAHYEKLRVRELLSPNPTLANELVFSPLENWNTNDVWVFLMQYKNPWGYNNNDLLTMYRGATADNECPLMVDKSAPSCGNSRFGCWVCTMVEKDKSMEAMIANDSDKSWMAPLLEFRNEIGNERLDKSRRDFRRRSGYLQGKNGKLYHGPYNKETREKWLNKLLCIQKEINKTAPDDFAHLELITLPELKAIREIWLNEYHEFDDSLPKIYEKAMGKSYPDDSVVSANPYGFKEWELLKEVCSPANNNGETMLFELMHSLIDIESKSNIINNRKGILDTIEKTISKTFYKDESDAESYYFNKIARKEKMGANYEPNIFDNILAEENEEYEDEKNE